LPASRGSDHRAAALIPDVFCTFPLDHDLNASLAHRLL